jgi:hypothetical protein
LQCGTAFLMTDGRNHAQTRSVQECWRVQILQNLDVVFHVARGEAAGGKTKKPTSPLPREDR